MKAIVFIGLLLLTGCASKLNVSGHIVFSYNEHVQVISGSVHKQATTGGGAE